jgi:hypothetical protein
MPVKKSKSMDNLPARKMPEGFKFPKNKKTIPNPPGTKRPGTKPAPLGTPPAKPKGRRPAPKPKTTKKAPGKMTPQDKAMKKILEKRYGKIYG